MNVEATLKEVHFLNFCLLGFEDVTAVDFEDEMVFHNVAFVEGISVDLEKLFHNDAISIAL